MTSVVKMSLYDLKDRKDWEKAIIVFTEDSFTIPFSLIERSYEVSRSNKYFQPDMIGNSLFGYCLDGIDMGVRLDEYIHAGGWKVDYCYIVE